MAFTERRTRPRSRSSAARSSSNEASTAGGRATMRMSQPWPVSLGLRRRISRNAPAHAITLDGASEAASGRDAEAVVIAAIGYEADDHESVRAGVALRADAREVLPGTECRHGPLRVSRRQSVSFLRPRARRVASTLRPLWVFMRLRKPCSLARWRFLGWYVCLVTGVWAPSGRRSGPSLVDRPADADVSDASHGAVDHLWPSRHRCASMSADYTRASPVNRKETEMSTDRRARRAALLEPGSATIEDFDAPRPARRADRLGADRSRVRGSLPSGSSSTSALAAASECSAQLTRTYPDPVPARRAAGRGGGQPAAAAVAGFRSEVLVLGALAPDGEVPLLGVDEGAEPGPADRVVRGGRCGPVRSGWCPQ